MSDSELRDIERRLAASPDDEGLKRLYERAQARAGHINIQESRRPMLRMTDLMVNKDKPGGEGQGGYRTSWGAGSQLQALRFYTDEKTVEVLIEWMEQDYQGSCFALLKVTKSDEGVPVYVIWRDSFGSCGGCDGLEDSNGYDYIEATLAEGNTRQFWSIQDAVDYLKTTEDYWWEQAKSTLLPEIEKLL